MVRIDTNGMDTSGMDIGGADITQRRRWGEWTGRTSPAKRNRGRIRPLGRSGKTGRDPALSARGQQITNTRAGQHIPKDVLVSRWRSGLSGDQSQIRTEMPAIRSE